MKGLTFAPTGAMVAAPTTSLPEIPEGERNWDYRWSWIRDSAFTLWGLHTLGFDWEANDYFWFLADLSDRDGDSMQIVYGVGGERDVEERIVPHVSGTRELARSGWERGVPATSARRHGAALDSIYIHTRSVERLDGRIWPVLRRQVDSAMGMWRKTDRGIWEVRGLPDTSPCPR